jgi:hypothetical protein
LSFVCDALLSGRSLRLEEDGDNKFLRNPSNDLHDVGKAVVFTIAVVRASDLKLFILSSGEYIQIGGKSYLNYKKRE